MYVCVYLYMYVCWCTRTCICVHVYVECICTCGYVRVYLYVLLCLVACYSDSDPFVQSKLGNRRFGLVPVMDPIHWRFVDRPMRWSVDQYGSCSEDQTTIRFQNHVILCECLFLSYFLIYRCQYVFVFYFYHFMWLFEIFYRHYHLYHFMRHQWAFTLIV